MHNVYITNAPEEYDYWYTKTLVIIDSLKGKRLRIIQHSDTYRFENFQVPRYQSGLYFCHRIDSEEASVNLGKDKELALELVQVKLNQEGT